MSGEAMGLEIYGTVSVGTPLVFELIGRIRHDGNISISDRESGLVVRYNYRMRFL